MKGMEQTEEIFKAFPGAGSLLHHLFCSDWEAIGQVPNSRPVRKNNPWGRIGNFCPGLSSEKRSMGKSTMAMKAWCVPALSSLVLVWGVAPRAQAADRVLLKYGILQESIAVQDLTTLAQTGKAPNSLQAYLDLAHQDPERVRRSLTQEVRVNPIILDRALNNPIGAAVLDQVGEAIYPSSRTANRQALRSALVLSATGDSKLSLLEVIQKYPTAEVVVDGDRLVQVAHQLKTTIAKVQNPLDLLK